MCMCVWCVDAAQRPKAPVASSKDIEEFVPEGNVDDFLEDGKEDDEEDGGEYDDR